MPPIWLVSCWFGAVRREMLCGLDDPACSRSAVVRFRAVETASYGLEAMRAADCEEIERVDNFDRVAATLG